MLFGNNYLKPVAFENSKEGNRKSNCKYACKYCDKKFTQWHSAKAHERTHTGEKSYACNYCDKKFSHLRSLKQIKLFTLKKNIFAGRIATTKLQLKPVL